MTKTKDVYMARNDVPKVAVILAGGEGTRLRPLTYEIPKPLIPVKGRPAMEQLIEELIYSGVERVVVSIGYKADKVMDYFNKTQLKDVIDYAVETKPLGTGGALKFALSKVGEEDFIDINGDNLYDIGTGLKEMYALHKKEGAMATLALKEVEDVTGLGVIVMDGNRIAKFVEKPDPKVAPSHLVNIGFYIGSKSKILKAFPSEEAFSMERDVFEKNTKNTLCGYVFKGDWRMTDNFQRYEDAIKNWKPLSERKK